MLIFSRLSLLLSNETDLKPQSIPLTAICGQAYNRMVMKQHVFSVQLSMVSLAELG
jgi:hypothetical protein